MWVHLIVSLIFFVCLFEGSQILVLSIGFFLIVKRFFSKKCPPRFCLWAVPRGGQESETDHYVWTLTLLSCLHLSLCPHLTLLPQVKASGHGQRRRPENVPLMSSASFLSPMRLVPSSSEPPRWSGGFESLAPTGHPWPPQRNSAPLTQLPHTHTHRKSSPKTWF